MTKTARVLPPISERAFIASGDYLFWCGTIFRMGPLKRRM